MPDSQIEDPFVWLAPEAGAPASLPEAIDFDEEAYLRAFPDVARAVGAGIWSSARSHFEQHGCKENRLIDGRYLAAIAARGALPQPSELLVGAVEVVFVTRQGMCLIVGWADDYDDPLVNITVRTGSRTLNSTYAFARCRRQDAEELLGGRGAHLLGFWTLVSLDGSLPKELLTIEVQSHRALLTAEITPKCVTDPQLRERVFGYFAEARYFGNKQVESFIQLEGGVGKALTSYNEAISQRIISGAHVARFGTQRQRLDGSIVVCLYGKAEFLFLQAALFTEGVDLDRYEFIYVSNSPSLVEKLQREATIAARLYDIAITLVVLPDNAGFGAANNAAVRFARSERIMIVNPDVFPRRADWANVHSALLLSRPPEQTRIFGVPLYYDDGSLMHAGLFFEMDEGWSIRSEGVERRRLTRVEHCGKGAPAESVSFLRSRPVAAVTGAFISIDRAWFEKLNGFSLEFVFGHYEDADLCLKSLAQGQRVWLHDLPFWHLEGKGSTRMPVHEAGSLVNRWHFTTKWRYLLEDGLLGRTASRLESR